MTRIKSDNVQLGSSYVIPIEKPIAKEQLDAESKKINLQCQEQIRQTKMECERLLVEAKEQANKIVEESQTVLKNAQEQATTTVETAIKQANEESTTIKEAAYKEGFEKGHSDGYIDGTNALNEKVIAVDTFAKSNFDIKNSILKSAEKDIIDLVIAIAEKVCQCSLQINPEILKEMTLCAIKSLKEKESINITVNPALTKLMYSISDELKEKIPQLSSIKILEDSSISKDGTIVESLLSRVDCRVKTQINEIGDKLISTISERNEEGTENDLQ